jgi:hypothetical protein
MRLKLMVALPPELSVGLRHYPLKPEEALAGFIQIKPNRAKSIRKKSKGYEAYMERRKIIVILGIISMILLVSQSVDASYVAYTKDRYPACANILDFQDLSLFLKQGDTEAVAKMVEQGRCIVLERGVKVFAWNPLYEAHPDWIQIHAVGSTVTLWTFRWALEERTQEKKMESPPKRVRKLVNLDSLSWVRVGKTTRQEIIKKYPGPRFRDESGGEYAYYGHQHPDFKGWDAISFIFDGNVLAEIRAEKEEK